MQADPRYKLLGRAYPYMARRLLTDPAPELRESFEDLIILVSVVQQASTMQALPHSACVLCMALIVCSFLAAVCALQQARLIEVQHP